MPIQNATAKKADAIFYNARATRVPLAYTSSELWPIFTLAPVTDFEVNTKLVFVCLFVVVVVVVVVVLRLIEVTRYSECVKQTYLKFKSHFYSLLD